MIPIYSSYLPQKSLKYAHEALDSGWISCHGPYLEKISEKLQNLLGVKYVIPVCNGTMACHLMAKAVQYKYKISEVIVPNNVYIASWNCFLFDNNYKLFSVDADLNTWNYDLNQLEKTINSHPKAAILITHNIASIINVPELKKKFPNRVFVEDSCEAFGGRYNHQFAGTASFASAFSFFGNKLVCSGEGGVFCLNDSDTYEYIKVLYNQGQSKTRFIHDICGTNFRMTNVHAAILYGQLEILDEILEKKAIVFNRYREAFKDREDIIPQATEEGTEFSKWMCGFRIQNQKEYKKAEEFFKARKIETRQMFFPMNSHRFLNENDKIVQGDHTVANQLNRKCLILPSFPGLKEEEQRYIIEVVEEYLRETK